MTIPSLLSCPRPGSMKRSSGRCLQTSSFVPRNIDWDPQAVPIPYHHSNLDSDEVIYYAGGNYAARRGIEVGSITLHPRGLAQSGQARWA
jgi:homogentisate 1,2-dioxygenase